MAKSPLFFRTEIDKIAVLTKLKFIRLAIAYLFNNPVCNPLFI